MKDYDIAVVGLGYIGLPTAALFASRGKKVLGIDVNQDVIDVINNGGIHIIEPGLELIVKTTTAEGFFSASVSPQPAGVFIIAVPTPFMPSDTLEGAPKPDLSYIRSAAIAISKVLKKGDLVILESTSPVGTTEKLAGWLAAERKDLTFPHESSEDSDIRIAFCPERVLPGQVMKELVENDRIIGGITERCSVEAIAVYKTFVKGEFFRTNARTAEMTKLTENASRDVGVAFANELSVLCDDLNINVWELIRLANRHPRVNILDPGAGVGGHCIAVDPWFIVAESPEDAKLIKTAREVNLNKPEWVLKKVDILVNRVTEQLSLKPEEMCVAFYGIAFKANIDDLRESPALEIAGRYATHSLGKVFLVEPNISSFKSQYDNASLESLLVAQKEAHVHVILVAHNQFKNASFNEIDKNRIIDVVGLLS